MRCAQQDSYPASVRSHGAKGQRPFALRHDSKRKGGHVAAAEGRWRELRAQGAQIDAAARAEPPRRRLEAVPEKTSAAKKPLAKKPLGLVWVLSPSYLVLYAGGGMEEDWLEGMGRVRELYPGVPLLVFGSQLDLGLASSALKDGADGFVHAMMHPSQVLRAVEVVQKGE